MGVSLPLSVVVSKISKSEKVSPIVSYLEHLGITPRDEVTPIALALWGVGGSSSGGEQLWAELVKANPVWASLET